MAQFAVSSALFPLFLCLFFAPVRCSLFETYKWPTVGVSVIVRNKAHTLPYFLSCLHHLDYPKDRMYLWIYSENNEDGTVPILQDWVQHYGKEYANVYLKAEPSFRISIPATQWDEVRFRHMIQLREKAMDFARKAWADYIFMIDADVFLTDKMSLKSLVSKNVTVVAPMLMTDGLYSNFWCGITNQYYYERTDDYIPILNRKKQGCFEVPMVHTAVLINLREVRTDMLTYDPSKVSNYNGPVDDIITFAISSMQNNIKLHVCNDLVYGFVTIPLEDLDELSDDMEQLLNIKLEAIGHGTPLPLQDAMKKYVRYPQPWKFAYNEIYIINLERRSERLQLMEHSFKELGMAVKLVKAVDGKDLNPEELLKRGITLMAKYEDPYHTRPMKMGEVGCFLSHYSVWQDIVDKHHAMSLVLEDDIHFEPYFRSRMAVVLEEIHDLSWDIVYIGRKILLDKEEERISEHVVRPLYSYWTLGYILRESGARKLLDASPLDKLLPVDEFLPIMFDQHPNDTWKSYFPRRDLIALSASPLLVKPTHYTGEEGYISDTEGSDIVPEPTPTLHVMSKNTHPSLVEPPIDTSYHTDL